MIYAQPHWRRLTYGFAFLALLGAAPQASAEALSLDAIDTFIQYRVCANACTG